MMILAKLLGNKLRVLAYILLFSTTPYISYSQLQKPIYFKLICANLVDENLNLLRDWNKLSNNSILTIDFSTKTMVIQLPDYKERIEDQISNHESGDKEGDVFDVYYLQNSKLKVIMIKPIDETEVLVVLFNQQAKEHIAFKADRPLIDYSY